jgi:hypothetical protein
MAGMWKVPEHERVAEVATTGTAVGHAAIVTWQGDADDVGTEMASTETMPAVVIVVVVLILHATTSSPAVHSNDGAVVEAVEHHQPGSLLLLELKLFVACSVVVVVVAADSQLIEHQTTCSGTSTSTRLISNSLLTFGDCFGHEKAQSSKLPRTRTSLAIWKPILAQQKYRTRTVIITCTRFSCKLWFV